MDGHRMHTFNNPVLIFCAVAAWMVALVAAVGLVMQGTDKTALAFAFAGFAVVGALPLLIVRRRRQKGKAWSSELAAVQRATSNSRPPA
jgi:type VI protein secretion system component VasK